MRTSRLISVAALVLLSRAVATYGQATGEQAHLSVSGHNRADSISSLRPDEVDTRNEAAARHRDARCRATRDCAVPAADGLPTLAKAAEAHGYIVAAVTGYHANATGVGGWNVPYPMVQVPRTGRGAGAGRRGGGEPPAPPTAEDFARAEQDVLNVADLVAKEYNADPNRIYLMGNSSGGSAVWNIAAKYPQRWTAISPSAAPLEDASFPYEKLKKTPVLVVHGDMDTTMVFEASKIMVDHAKAKGVDATWLPVIGGKHVDAWAQPEILNQIFDFFDAHTTKAQ